MAIKELTKIQRHLFLCNGGSCKLSGAEESIVAMRAAIAENNLTEEVHTTKTLCNGRCNDGPIVICLPDGIWFQKIDKSYAASFVKEFLVDQILPEEKVLYRYGQEVINVK